MQRHFPLARPCNVAIHAVALVAFSIAHTLGMGALRMLWFAGILGEASFRFPITLDRLGYEFTKDHKPFNRDYDLTELFSAGTITSTVGDLMKWDAAIRRSSRGTKQGLADRRKVLPPRHDGQNTPCDC